MSHEPVKTNEASKCVRCGFTLDAANGVDANGPRIPNPGDLSVCLYCGTVMAFTDRLLLRELEREEIEALRPEEKEDIAIALKVSETFKMWRHYQQDKI